MKNLLFMSIFILASGSDSFAKEVVSAEYKEEPSKQHQSTYGVERIFKNRALASGLDRGVASLNRSIDSLMEALFYSVMDNDLFIDVTDSSEFGLGLNRDVHSTTDGAYVVIDRFSIGPRFSSEISRFEQIPITFGVEGSVNVLDIYLRNDAQRVSETERLPVWRNAVNNWFGILPTLSQLLPPSFNPNELYDPLGQVETPFIFPKSYSAAMEMPVGNIRSYSVSGIVHIGLDLLARKVEQGSKVLDLPVDMSFPYTIFKNSEHRINVLRRSGKRFWVGLASSDRVGHKLSSSVGKVYSIFDKVSSGDLWDGVPSPRWSGIPATILPIDIEESAANVFEFDMVFEFDFDFESARSAFEYAVKGDFSHAEKLYLKEKNHGIRGGVRFLFKRHRNGKVFTDKYSGNYFVTKNSSDSYSDVSDVVTEDPSGKFEVLEGRRQWESEVWDVIVGAERVTYETRSTVRLASGGDTLDLDASTGQPYSFIFGLNINDRYVDALEFRSYIEDIEDFGNIDLTSYGQLPIRNQQRLDAYRSDVSLSNPLNDIERLFVTPTTLGKLTVDGAIYFSTEAIDKLKSMSNRDLMRYFLQGYNIDSIISVDDMISGSFVSWLGRLGSFLTVPFKVLNYDLLVADAVNEVSSRMDAINSLRAANSPEEIVMSLQDLSDTNYPLNLAISLNSALGDTLPRSIRFQTKASRRGDLASRKFFESMNRRVYKAGGALPNISRYQYVRDQLKRFNPQSMREVRRRPQIKSLELSKVEGSAYPFDFNLAIEVTDVADYDDLRVFIRLEQSGKVNVGRFLLAEAVMSAKRKAWLGGDDERRGLVEVRVNPDSGRFDGFLIKQAFELGGGFNAWVSISSDGSLWSEDRQIKFSYENKSLGPSM